MMVARQYGMCNYIGCAACVELEGLILSSLVQIFGDHRTDAPASLTIIAIFRNESSALCEWVEHYQSLSADNFYLIDNNSDDGGRRLLERYRTSSRINLFTCARDAYQVGAYMELLPRLRGNSEWIGVFDLDEFVYPPNGVDLRQSLSAFDDAAAVLVPWLSFGSNGHVEQPRSIVQSFTRRGDAGCSRAFLKAFTRPECVDLLSQHNPTLSKGVKRLANGAVFGDDWYIDLREDDLPGFAIVNNHYRLQSKNHFRRVKAGRPEVNEDAQDRVKSLRFFDEYDALWSRIEDRRLADRLTQPRASSV